MISFRIETNVACDVVGSRQLRVVQSVHLEDESSASTLAAAMWI